MLFGYPIQSSYEYVQLANMYIYIFWNLCHIFKYMNIHIQ
jgi:hypothetical protein